MKVEKIKKAKTRGFSVNRENILKYTGQTGLPIEALANMMDVNRSTIYHLQNGQNASPEVLKNISVFLGVPLEELLLDKEDGVKVKKKIMERHISTAKKEEVEALWTALFPFHKKEMSWK
ncbi:MAG: helix-turn-helix transcriptional regulator [Lachnospiraceae bacterium]|jgi:transcriptional regulator with XRE-family HTH domain|nr:helix-turn-helix transcriptional regulator [Lachnospiraceae bacterium]